MLLQIVALLLTAMGAGAVVLVRDPLRQLLTNGLYGLILTALFMVFQAPDVALSMLVVGGIAFPLIVLTSISRVRAEEEREEGG